MAFRIGAGGLGGWLAALPWLAIAQGVPALGVPVDCEIGRACVVQNYVDHDPGPAARDYRCGLLTYEGHRGTDFRVIDPAALQRGVAVIAAAPGRVRATRDGMPDVSMRVAGKEAIAGRDAGNTVVIEHGDGWETQYGHMRNGSVTVKPGQVVERGQRLGLVGLSGNTEFYHVHFEVRHQRKAMDPFVGPAGTESCSTGREPLWLPQALAALSYVESGLIDAGISGSPPRLQASTIEREGAEAFDATSDSVFFWVQIYGARQDDVEEFRLTAPDGTVLAHRRSRVEHNLAQRITYTGRKKRGPSPWPQGTYRGEYALYRGPGERKLLSLVREVRIDAAAR